MRCSKFWQWNAMAVVLLLTPALASAADFSTGLSIGYGKSFAVRADGLMSNVAQGFPFGLGFAVTYTGVDPGDPWAARRIFVANAHNGTPVDHGVIWDFRMDLMYKINLSGPHAAYLFVGPRNSFFDGTFRYVDANEEFDVTSDQWGIGFGAKGLFAMNSRLDLAVTLGLDSYFNGSLHGHDSTYKPNNENINAKEDFSYEDAAAAINTPKLVPVLMIGVNFHL